PDSYPLSLHDALPILAGTARSVGSRAGRAWLTRRPSSYVIAEPLPVSTRLSTTPPATPIAGHVCRRARDGRLAMSSITSPASTPDRKSTRLNSSHVKI